VTVVLLTQRYPLFPEAIQDFSAGKNPCNQFNRSGDAKVPGAAAPVSSSLQFPNIDAAPFPAQTRTKKSDAYRPVDLNP
jgi:hypothetical protein